MTEEEKAEEYAKKSLKGFRDYIYLDQAETKIEDAYLAGLHEGHPKWHKVADGDLPKEHKLYLCAIKNNGNAICYFNGLHWENKYSMGDFGHCVETVIAWCEIPLFKE